LRIAEARFTQSLTRGVDIGRLRIADLDDHAAGKVDAQIEPAGGDQRERTEHQDSGDHIREPPLGQEVDRRSAAKKFHLTCS
jgi:hypothetical protein